MRRPIKPWTRSKSCRARRSAWRANCRRRRRSSRWAAARRPARPVKRVKAGGGKLAAGAGSAGWADEAVDVGGVKLARRRVAGLDKDALRNLADSLKAQIKSGVVVLASENDGKGQIVGAVPPDLTQKINAGQIGKEFALIVGGGGGGRPDFAEAGGKQPEKIDEMLAAAEGVVKRL